MSSKLLWVVIRFLQKNVNEWQPRNYIDKIVIAELFSLYGEGVKALARKISLHMRST